MRFSANQLRVLQEDLSLPVPPMLAPPDLALGPPAVQQPQQAAYSFWSQSQSASPYFWQQQPQQQQPASPTQQQQLAYWHQPQQAQPQQQRSSRVPGWVLLPAYLSVGFFCGCVVLAWPSALPSALLFAGISPLPAALVVHALASPQSRLAQAVAALSVVFLPAACGSGHPAALSLAACLVSAFFCAASSAPPALRLLSPLFSLAVWTSAALASAADHTPQLQRGAWLVLSCALCAQAAAASARLSGLELSCVVRQPAA